MGFRSVGAAEDGRAPTEELSCFKGWSFCSTGRPWTAALRLKSFRVLRDGLMFDGGQRLKRV